MKYQEYSLTEFFTQIDSESKAIELIWQCKAGEKGFSCSKCSKRKYYQLKSRPEVRECKSCGHHNRLRVDTIFQNSKVPMLTWLRAIYLMMMGKRGVSALELQRQLKVKTYKTAWAILYKVRHALMDRDSPYRLEGILEMDGAKFGKVKNNNQEKVLIAIETKQWIDDKGRANSKAGFAKVFMGAETKENTKEFIEQSIRITSELHTDEARAYLFSELETVNLKTKPMYSDPERLYKWLPWVHKFISNAKAWIIGTHHGVSSEMLKLYLAEYTYLFNRRHDTKRFFSRALFACTEAGQIKL